MSNVPFEALPRDEDGVILLDKGDLKPVFVEDITAIADKDPASDARVTLRRPGGRLSSFAEWAAGAVGLVLVGQATISKADEPPPPRQIIEDRTPRCNDHEEPCKNPAEACWPSDQPTISIVQLCRRILDETDQGGQKLHAIGITTEQGRSVPIRVRCPAGWKVTTWKPAASEVTYPNRAQVPIVPPGATGETIIVVETPVQTGSELLERIRKIASGELKETAEDAQSLHLQIPLRCERHDGKNPEKQIVPLVVFAAPAGTYKLPPYQPVEPPKPPQEPKPQQLPPPEQPKQQQPQAAALRHRVGFVFMSDYAALFNTATGAVGHQVNVGPAVTWTPRTLPNTTFAVGGEYFFNTQSVPAVGEADRMTTQETNQKHGGVGTFSWQRLKNWTTSKGKIGIGILVKLFGGGYKSPAIPNTRGGPISAENGALLGAKAALAVEGEAHGTHGDFVGGFNIGGQTVITTGSVQTPTGEQREWNLGAGPAGGIGVGGVWDIK